MIKSKKSSTHDPVVEGISVNSRYDKIRVLNIC